MIRIGPHLSVNEAELQLSFIRAPGPGGQNVNKVATAVQLRFDVQHSPSLPEEVRARFIRQNSSKMTTAGEIIIKASRYRTQESNKQDAIERLQALLLQATIAPKKRRKTKPSFGSVQRRLSTKKLHAKTKALRGRKATREG